MKVVGQLGSGTDVGDTYRLTLVAQGRLNPHPYNVIDAQFVAKYNLAVIVDINDSSQRRRGDTKIVEEGGILTVQESIILIIQTLLLVSKEEQNTRAHIFFQLRSALNISLFSKHNNF